MYLFLQTIISNVLLRRVAYENMSVTDVWPWNNILFTKHWWLEHMV